MPANLFAALAGALNNLSGGVNDYQQEQLKKKKDAADLLLRQQAEARLGQIAQSEIGHRQFEEGQVGRTNTLQDLTSIQPGSEVPSDLAEAAIKNHLDYLIKKNTVAQNPQAVADQLKPQFGTFDANGMPSAFKVDLPPIPTKSITTRVPTDNELRQDKLDQSLLDERAQQIAASRATTQNQEAAANINAQKFKQQQDAQKRVQDALSKHMTPDPYDIIMASGHTLEDIDPQTKIDILKASHQQPLAEDFTGFDPNGVPTFRTVPNVIGGYVHKQPLATPAGIKTKEQQAQEIYDLASTILEQGNALHGSGVGPIAGRLGDFSDTYLNSGDSPEAKLRTEINNLFSGFAVGRYGSQFPPSEQALAKKYLPSETLPWAKNKTNLESLLQFVASQGAKGKAAGSQPTQVPIDAVSYLNKLMGKK